MDTYFIFISIILIIIILFIAFILHKVRSPSTYAEDYFKNLKNISADEDECEESLNKLKDEIIKNKIDDESMEIRKKHLETYALLLEKHKNNRDIGCEYLSLSELAALKDMDINEFINYLFMKGLIESRESPLVLTEKGIKYGGKYRIIDELELIGFPKKLFAKLGMNEDSKHETVEISEYRDSDSSAIWMVIIIIIFGYVFFR